MNDNDSPVPMLLALLACDMIIVDESTQKKTLVGVFDRISLPPDVNVLGGFAVYARLTDAEGRYAFSLRLVYLDDDQDKTRAQFKTSDIEIPDRLGTFELALRGVPPLPFERDGQYELQFWANDVYVGRTVLTVKRSTEEGGK